MRILTDDDALALTPAEAVAAMREALLAHERGEYHSPPRLSLNVGDVRLILGAGGDGERGVGLRVAGPANAPLEHLTVTWTPQGAIDAVIVGNEIGARRTGAVAAVAADLLARPGALRVGLLGSGRNGWAQIWGLTGAREVAALSVFSPNPAHREAFAARARDELSLDAVAVGSAREATDAMDVVILCTTSREPVIEADWVAPRAHVTSIGAKTTSAHEAPAELLVRTRRVVSDAPDDLTSPLSELAGLPLVALGRLLGEGVPARGDDEVSLFLYCGLGGADAAYGQAVARRG
ncbi:MAG TPA: hypothetical protein VNF07_12370 [Acidimicrobiales bacterium]|nr:hypothetical protein [Acidimicrobiales bacterium]